MGIKRIIAPTVEPITVAEAKLHQRIDVADDDALVSMWITSIREHAEHLTGRTLAPTTWCLYLDEFSTEIRGNQCPVHYIPLFFLKLKIALKTNSIYFSNFS
jgi:uncharacterized phiE125 gp8 family phage protein